jgi:1-acyl-sn-glycerol-3-phosphate acyltransferase
MPRRKLWLLYWFGYWVFALIYLFGYSYRAFGRRRWPMTGPLLIIANHESFWDPPIVGVAVGRRVAYMARKTLWNNRAMAWFMNTVGTFPVDQEGIGLDGIKMALKKLQQGEAVVVFPEGTRTEDGKLGPFMQGIALLVRKSKATVLPVGLGGAYEAWPIHATKPKWAPIWGPPHPASIAAVVGQPIASETLVAMEPKAMLAYLRDRVAELRVEAYRRKRLPTPPL